MYGLAPQEIDFRLTNEVIALNRKIDRNGILQKHYEKNSSSVLCYLKRKSE